ncbi:MAG: alpha/beta fold hydrolase [Pseudomonadota bacterium]
MLPQRLLRMARRLAKPSLLAACLALSHAPQAAIVEIQTPAGMTATAEYRPGDVGKPAALVLHSFLQTREFGTTKILADALADEGYTVLSPNLTLGISHRKRSLDCEALHLHDMEGDIREIQLWVQWLRKRGHPRIVGIGHSFGATQLLAWRQGARARGFAIVGISLIGSDPFILENKPSRSGKAAPPPKPVNGLIQAPLSFCEAFTAPRDRHASYAQWNESRTLAALGFAGAQTDVILGSEDKYLPKDWNTRLARAGARVKVIWGANHFMDGPQEFDMLDAVIDALKR